MVIRILYIEINFIYIMAIDLLRLYALYITEFTLFIAYYIDQFHILYGYAYTLYMVQFHILYGPGHGVIRIRGSW